jgi:formate C-acetyltransferase
VGIGTITDAASAVKYHVFDEATVSMDELLAALAADFEDGQDLRRRLMEITPRYGNDDDYADGIMQQFFEAYFEAVDGRPNTRGGTYHVNLLPTTCHIYFGSVLGATPDGRRAGTPTSEGVSPVQGADRRGPTAVLRSVAKMDHLRTGGTLLNQRLAPGILDTEEGLQKWVALVRSYFRMNGHHVQYNVFDADVLRAAQEDPDSYRDLIVRVAGYSDYFCDLGRTLQDEIISRTEHAAV